MTVQIEFGINVMRGWLWRIHSRNGWKPIIERRFDQSIGWYGRLQERLKAVA